MGNCFGTDGTPKKSTAGIAPSDFLKGSPVVRFSPIRIRRHFGNPQTRIQYVDLKFPDPPSMRRCIWSGRMTPFVAAAFQHRSVTWHLERMVRCAEDLAARGGRGRGDPSMGSPRMEMMLEHAQMEEKVVFPILEGPDRGKI
ncbi:hypothetical protein Acr_22g0008970 [Actinidia rufa]|uniref:Hemerythrin-like domain-containing protein n=1 Tax=Actinidia rufa TaxID=165716 RepID=A0A7J0GL03_9ERIC|nr:hypothetical protein Acr_22g0008970 [Actinidia rufa]